MEIATAYVVAGLVCGLYVGQYEMRDIPLRERWRGWLVGTVTLGSILVGLLWVIGA